MQTCPGIWSPLVCRKPVPRIGALLQAGPVAEFFADGLLFLKQRHRFVEFVPIPQDKHLVPQAPLQAGRVAKFAAGAFLLLEQRHRFVELCPSP